MARRQSLLFLGGGLLLLAVALAGEDNTKKDAQQPAAAGPKPANTQTASPRRKAPAEEPANDLASRQPTLRVDTNMVLINVTVTDPLNRFVTGLEAENFKLFEDKSEQRIASFASEDAPLSVGLVFDASSSMGSKLQKARLATAQFFKTANPEDEFFLVQFNDKPEMIHGFTTNTEEIQNRLTFTQAKGRTALLDGIYMALNHMKKARNTRKAILVLSDGGDNSSRYTETEIKNLVREADVQIYAIGLFEGMSGRSRTPEEMSGPGLLNDIAEQTGGRHFPVENINDLPDVAAKVGMELRNQYVIGYIPINANRDGKYRRVQVKINPIRGLPTLRAFWRQGYYAPAQ